MSGSARPLAVTSDEQILDDLVRLAAASGATLEVSQDAADARRLWSTAPLVIVGADQADAMSRAAPHRRTGVVVVGRQEVESLALWAHAVRIGVDDVVQLPDQDAWLAGRLADAVELADGRSAVVVGVVGGRGGAGASTLAAALAGTDSALGRRTVLIDVDPLGGGIDLALGAEDRPGLRWPDLCAADGRIDTGVFSSALPRIDGLSVLSWDRGGTLAVPAAAVRTALDAARRYGELVVVDLPRHVDDAVLEALARCGTVLLVVPAELRAVAAAGRVATMLRPLVNELRLVVRTAPVPGLDGRDIADSLDLALVGQVRSEPKLGRAMERGVPPARHGKGQLVELCRSILADLGLSVREAA